MTHEPHEQYPGYGDTGYADGAGYGTPGTRGAPGAHGGYGPQADGSHPAPAPGSWGGEYDAEATAFVQLPGPGGWPAGADPLAAPGTGQGGYTPPVPAGYEYGGGAESFQGNATAHDAHQAYGPGTGGGQGPYEGAEPVPGGAPMTPAATTDPSATGQWTMPFAAPTPAAATPAAAGLGGEPGAGAYTHFDTTAAAHDGPARDGVGQGRTAHPDSGDSTPQPGGAVAAMGQGAAAALAGSHEARTQRRPLGAGGAAGRTDEPLDAVGDPGLPGSYGALDAAAMPQSDTGYWAPAAPVEPVAGAGPGVQQADARLEPGRPEMGGAMSREAELADSMARRQVPFAGTPAADAVSWPEPGSLTAPGPAAPGPADQVPRSAPFQAGHPDTDQAVSAPGPIPYAESTPGGSAPSSSDGDAASPAPAPTPAADADLPAPVPRGNVPGGGIPGGGLPGGGLAGTPSWPEPGSLPAPGGNPSSAVDVPFASSVPEDPSWPESAVAGPSAGADPSEDAGSSADAGPPVSTASASGPAAGASAQSRIPFVESTPGRAAAPPPPGAEADEPSTAAASEPADGDSPTGPSGPAESAGPTAEAESAPPTAAAAEDTVPAPGTDRHDAADRAPVPADADGPGDHPGNGRADAAATHPAPGTDGWRDAPSGPGPDDSGEYVTAPAADALAHAAPTATPERAEPASAQAADTVATAYAEDAADLVEPAAPAHSEHPHVSYALRVNGVERPVTEAWIGESLLYVLRERLGLAGAKDGCSQGECGACSVQVDGRLVASCLVPAATAAGSEVRTVEGLAGEDAPSDVQRALARCGAVQCGFCVPGLAMAVHDLLEGNHTPTELEARQAICGNLCRCSGYRGVLDAVETVASERAAAHAAEAAPSVADSEPSSEGGDE